MDKVNKQDRLREGVDLIRWTLHIWIWILFYFKILYFVTNASKSVPTLSSMAVTSFGTIFFVFLSGIARRRMFLICWPNFSSTILAFNRGNISSTDIEYGFRKFTLAVIPCLLMISAAVDCTMSVISFFPEILFIPFTLLYQMIQMVDHQMIPKLL